MFLRRIILCCVLGLLWSSAVNAGVENRPINTDDAYTLDKGTFTVALGTVFTRADNRDKETDLTIDLGYGLTERLEITADIPIVFSNPQEGNNVEGRGDITIRPELLLSKEDEHLPAISFASTIKTHSGNKDRGLGSGENDYSLSLQFSKDFNPWKYHFNIGYTFAGQPKEEAIDDVIFYNLAAEYGLSDRLTLVGELIGDTNSDADAGKTPFEGLLGFIYNIKNNLALDFGIGVGFTKASPDIRLTSGLTYEF